MLLVLLVAAAGGWFYLQHHRPSLRGGETYGVDVSAHQGEIDWPAVAADDIDFAYLKATEGATFTDSMFVANWTASGAAGVRRGAYHFFTLCSPAAAQAAHFLAVAGTQAELPPALDLELNGNCGRRPSAADVDAEVTAFVTAVEKATAERVLLYVGEEFADRYRLSVTRGRDLWVRHLLRRPSGQWRVWQARDRAHVKGIRGSVDLDVGRWR